MSPFILSFKTKLHFGHLLPRFFDSTIWWLPYLSFFLSWANLLFTTKNHLFVALDYPHETFLPRSSMTLDFVLLSVPYPDHAFSSMVICDPLWYFLSFDVIVLRFVNLTLSPWIIEPFQSLFGWRRLDFSPSIDLRSLKWSVHFQGC